MGIKVLREILDEEIADFVNKLNEFSFLQTRSSCSGYGDPETENSRSDGVNRVWRGRPYISFWVLEPEAYQFVEHVMRELVFDHRAADAPEKQPAYAEKLSKFEIQDDGKQLIHATLEWRNGKMVVSIYIDDRDRNPETIMKIWKLFESAVDSYKTKE